MYLYINDACISLQPIADIFTVIYEYARAIFEQQIFNQSKCKGIWIWSIIITKEVFIVRTQTFAIGPVSECESTIQLVNEIKAFCLLFNENATLFTATCSIS